MMIVPEGHRQRTGRALSNMIGIIAAGRMGPAKALSLIARAHPTVTPQQLADVIRRREEDLRASLATLEAIRGACEVADARG